MRHPKRIEFVSVCIELIEFIIDFLLLLPYKKRLCRHFYAKMRVGCTALTSLTLVMYDPILSVSGLNYSYTLHISLSLQ